MAPPLKKGKKKKKKKLPRLSKSRLQHQLVKKYNKEGSNDISHFPLLHSSDESPDFEWWLPFSHRASSPPPGSGAAISDLDEAFKHFFRVSVKTFVYICSLVRQDLISRPPSGLINIEGRLLSVEKQVAIAMRRLASGESQVSVGGEFGVGQSTVSQVTWRFIESMEERGRQHLSWPSPDRLVEIKTKFEATFGLSNCCGAIDATHIIMTLPAVEISDDWCDQSNNYSIFLQAIVDEEMRFLDIATGWPGRMTMSRLLTCTGFYKLCESGMRLNGPLKALKDGAEIREYIVGSMVYPLLPWLLTPYKEDEDLSRAKRCFNEKHGEARSLAERSLSQLKGSWRILHKVMWRPDKTKLPSIILVCCLLHNIVIDSGDKLNQDVSLTGHHDSGYTLNPCHQPSPEGVLSRNNLLKQFNEDLCLKSPA